MDNSKSLHGICYTILFLFYVFFFLFVCKACGLLASRTGIEPTSLALEGKVLTIGLPGKSQNFLFLVMIKCFSKYYLY